eukprot:TRINITY_DN3864_c0_g1_i1.p1 TRINITY_DN3864_c0_g1~~TRINITY_DN3864_c0_g1_i1.p1  ORF type:complete len:503 (-),score=96.16 TRINITY_DN3864_c0_g1_i1:100-1608(-)
MNPVVSIPAYETIKLLDNEQRILSLLREVAQKDPELSNLTIRVAGGWVRDKILGLESHDLDVALDITSGATFANKVNEYMKLKGEEVHGIGVVQTNPDQSKHLETAIIRVFGVPIDMVNLRCEEYTENSRIPEIKIGTPLQDAERRDLTINALFYNVTNDTIEDFTGKGLQDIKDRIIRTPLAPLTTFLDDPLRVLRTIRFTARFGYHLLPDIIDAALQEAVRVALKSKISRERIGVEVSKAIEGPRPVRALHLIHTMGLSDAVFSLPTGVFTEEMSSAGLQFSSQIHGIIKAHPFDADQADNTRLVVLASYLLPVKDMTYRDAKNREHGFGAFVVRESLKLKNKDAEAVDLIHRGLDKMTQLWRQYVETQTFDRLEAGLLLRQLGATWKLCLRVALAHACICSSHHDGLRSADPSDDLSYQCADDSFVRFVASISSLGLDNVWDMKPIMNGKELAQQLGIKPGPTFGVLMDMQIRWQIANPTGSVAECKEHLLEQLKMMQK